MAAKDDKHRHTGLLGMLNGSLKDRWFVDREANVESEQHKHGASEERQPPAEGEELPIREQCKSKRKVVPEHRKPMGAPSCGNIP